MLGHEKDYNNLKEILDNAKDIIYSIDLIPNFKFTYINNAIYDILGYSPKEILMNPNVPFEIVHKDDEKHLRDKIKGTMDYSKPKTSRFFSKSGVYKWIEDYVMPRYNKKGQLSGVYGIARDVTKQKELELELKRLKNKDDLTQVYSRYFLKSTVDKFEGKIGQVGIFLIDIDKLKSVNDTFGHLEGDTFICLVAQSLVENVGKAGCVCRNGGDEFVIIIENKDEDQCKNYYYKLKKESIYFHGENRGFSVGFAHSKGKLINIKKLLEEADKDMYKNKVQEEFIV